MQQAHRDRVDSERTDLTDQSIELGGRQRADDLALHVEALIDFPPLLERRERLRNLEIEVVEVVTPFAADVEHVAGAFGDDEAGGCAFTLDQGIGH